VTEDAKDATYLKSVIKDYISKEVVTGSNRPVIDDETKLIESGILDSLSVLQVVMYIEDKFGIQAGPEEIVAENFETVSAMSRYVLSKEKS